MEPVGGRKRYVPSVCQIGVLVDGLKRHASGPLLKCEEDGDHPTTGGTHRTSHGGFSIAMFEYQRGITTFGL